MAYPYQLPPPQNENTLSCGLLGCVGGLLFGLLAGGPLLLGLALLLALQADPGVPAGGTGPDLRLNVQETFLNRFVQNTNVGTAQVDILPGNQVSTTMDMSVSAFGVAVPVRVTGLFGLAATPQSIQVNLVDLQVSGIQLSPELREMLAADLPGLNQDLNRVLNDISAALGAPIVLTGLGTTETEFWLEAQEQP